MDAVSRRTRSRWDEYFKNQYSEMKRKKDQESGGDGGTGKRLRNDAVDSEYTIGRLRNVAGKRVSEKNWKLDRMRGKIANDIVFMSDDDVGFLNEQVVSNGSSLKTGPESRSGSGSKVGSLDEVVSSMSKKVGHTKVGAGSGGNSGRRGRGRPRIKPLDGEQMHCDVSVDPGNSMESSDGSDDSVDSDSDESESTSEEDDEVSDEDYRAGESSASESSDASSDVELEKDDEGEDELSDTVEDKRTLCAHKSVSTRMNERKESETEQEKDDESDGGCNVDDHGNRSSDHKKTEDGVIVINEKEFSSFRERGRIISKKKETEVELERDDDAIDVGYHETNDELEKDDEEGEEENLRNTVEDKRTICTHRRSSRMNERKESETEQSDEGYNMDDHGSGRPNRSSDHQKKEDGVIAINEDEFSRFRKSARNNKKKATEVALERDDDDEIDEGHHETSANWKKDEDVVNIIEDVEKFPRIRKSARKNQKGDDKKDGNLRKKNVLGVEVLVDSDRSNDKEEIRLAKCLRSSTVAQSQKKEPELGKYNSPVSAESASFADNEYKSSRDEDSCHFDRVVKRSKQCSEKKVKLGKKMPGATRKLDMIKILVESINARKDQQFTVEKDALPQNSLPLRFRFEDEVVPPPEKSEWEKHIDSLFCDLELGLRESEMDCTNYSDMENDHLNSKEINETPAACCGRGEHLCILDEQIGIVCKYCAAIILDIKYVLPDFYTPPFSRRERKDSDESPSSFTGQIQFPGSDCKTPYSTTCVRGTVWDLIPGIESGMFPHQLEGVEFIWKNIAGDIIIEKLKQKETLSDGQGCIISHAPGTGKTRLTIVFLQTFLKLYPTCCPVIIAPRGTLLTWEGEFIKWNFNLPFHNLNKKELSGNENAIASQIFGHVGAGILSREVIRLLKLYSWTSGGGILGISYTLFEKLAGENGKEGVHEKIREVLLERPGLLVLDEGHTPRNERSLIWKALSKVATQRRIILSGTPFQNNLIELYNTLCLVNPKFVNQIGFGNETSCRTSRKRDSVARKRWTALTSSIGKNRDDGLKKLRVMLDPFVNVHKGHILKERIPGLRHTLVFLHPTECQKTLLETSSKVRNIFRRIRLVSLVSVHPSLNAAMKRDSLDTGKLEEIESDADAGVKMKFLLKLIWLADALGERVLVFSQFIHPLVFIKKQIESHFSWIEGRELLYMDGQLDEKQRQDSISSFNNDTSRAKVLLASERACSEGISLVGASRVVLLDTVWNPFVEKQAISRAYRVGQKKVVYVYRLFTSGIEVRQFAQQLKKVKLSKLIFSPGDGQTSQSENSPIISEDKVLEAMLSLERFNHIFEKIIYQPKESDLIEIFGLKDLNKNSSKINLSRIL